MCRAGGGCAAGVLVLQAAACISEWLACACRGAEVCDVNFTAQISILRYVVYGMCPTYRRMLRP